MPLVVGNIVELRIYCSLAEQTSINVRHFEVMAIAGASAEVSDVAIFMDVALAPLYAAAMAPAANYDGSTAQVIHPGRLAYYANLGLVNPGTVTGDPLPRQTSGLIRFRSAIAGSRGVGRLYVPFPSEGSNTAAGHPVAAYQTAIGAIADVFETTAVVGAGGDTADLRPIIWHRDTQTGIPITQGIGSSRWATQRRRGDYGQPNRPPA